jgi:hypothetical protein
MNKNYEELLFSLFLSFKLVLLDHALGSYIAGFKVQYLLFLGQRAYDGSGFAHVG